MKSPSNSTNTSRTPTLNGATSTSNNSNLKSSIIEMQRQNKYNYTNGSLSPRARIKKHIYTKLLKLIINPFVLLLFTSLWISLNIILLRSSTSKVSLSYYTHLYSNYFQSKCKKQKTHRRFISYTSSQWEKLWINNIKTWETKRTICQEISKQRMYLQEFLNATCTARFGVSNWCLHDDTFQPFWINVKTLEHSSYMPGEIISYLMEEEERKKSKEDKEQDNRNEMITKRRLSADTITIFDDNIMHLNFHDKPIHLNLTNNEEAHFYGDDNLMFNYQQTIENPKSEPFQFSHLPEDENGSPKVLSKFIFLNELTNETFVEYIEPLVSHLRHPLALCNGYLRSSDTNAVNSIEDSVYGIEEDYVPNDPFYLLKRSYIIPSTSYLHGIKDKRSKKRKFYYFDAGASSWTEGAGGPSLDYFTKVWERHNINFDSIEAWEGNANYEDFEYTIPDKYRNRTEFHNAWIVSSIKEHTSKSPFLPLLISQKTTIDDYVLFKLDIDNGDVEIGVVNHLLQSSSSSSNCNDHLDYIDEFVWEHHVDGNYLLAPHWANQTEIGVSIENSYHLFLMLRERGVRAHSWV